MQHPVFITIEHVGSTAISGCGGKGTIDLLAIYQEGFLESTKDCLLSLGFNQQGVEFARRWPVERPMYLGIYRWDGEPFLIYIHVISRESDEVRRFRVFKERLFDSPALVAEYCSLKRQIIAEGVTDTDHYAIRKRTFMHRVLGPDHGISNTAKHGVQTTTTSVAPRAGAPGAPPPGATAL